MLTSKRDVSETTSSRKRPINRVALAVHDCAVATEMMGRNVAGLKMHMNEAMK